MSKYHKHFNPPRTPQTKPIPGEKMIPNAAGGFVYEISKWQRLERFLILGTEGGTYYATEKKLTKKNAANVLACLSEDGHRTVDVIHDISHSGRAPRQDETLFTYALACSFGDAATRAYAFSHFNDIVRIPTHLATFLNAVTEYRGWGPALRNAVSGFYNDKPLDKLAYHLVKYRSRYGWTHRDIFRLAHPKAKSEDRNAVYGWVTGAVVRDDKTGGYDRQHKDREGVVRGVEAVHLPEKARIIEGFERIKNVTDASVAIDLINEYKLPWEAVPTTLHKCPEIWMTILPGMPATALIRNLSRMAKIGMTKPFSEAEGIIVKKLSDHEWLEKSRIHPLNILIAKSIYDKGFTPSRPKGKGQYHNDHLVDLLERKDRQWQPNNSVSGALATAFYATFDNVEPTGKRIGLFLDVSGSMNGGGLCGSFINPRQASTALTLVTMAAETNVHVMAFSDGKRGGWGRQDDILSVLPFRRGMRIEDATKITNGLRFGATDCALPFVWALKNKINLDTAVIYTDSESFAGPIHVSQALRQYRREINPLAKLVVVAMTATKYSVANPDDAGMLDIVGFDTAAPATISNFTRG